MGEGRQAFTPLCLSSLSLHSDPDVTSFSTSCPDEAQIQQAFFEGLWGVHCTLTSLICSGQEMTGSCSHLMHLCVLREARQPMPAAQIMAPQASRLLGTSSFRILGKRDFLFPAQHLGSSAWAASHSWRTTSVDRQYLFLTFQPRRKRGGFCPS